MKVAVAQADTMTSAKMRVQEGRCCTALSLSANTIDTTLSPVVVVVMVMVMVRLEPHSCIWKGQAGELSAVPCYAFADLLNVSMVAPFLRRGGEPHRNHSVYWIHLNLVPLLLRRVSLYRRLIQ